MKSASKAFGKGANLGISSESATSYRVFGQAMFRFE